MTGLVFIAQNYIYYNTFLLNEKHFLQYFLFFLHWVFFIILLNTEKAYRFSLIKALETFRVYNN